jgi:hypothetical protein
MVTATAQASPKPLVHREGGSSFLWQATAAIGVWVYVVALHWHNADEWVFYDGRCAQLFSFYVRANDPGFQRGVVRASKLLYATKSDPKYGLIERGGSPGDVVDRLRRECGCRFLVIERQSPFDIPAQSYLREALTRSEFRLLRSFRVEAPQASEIDLYEYTGPLEIPDSFQIPFPLLGEKATYRVKPIRR